MNKTCQSVKTKDEPCLLTNHPSNLAADKLKIQDRKSNISKILVCVDKSTKKHVIEYASRFAIKHSYDIILFNVIESDVLIDTRELKKIVNNIAPDIENTPSNFLPKYDIEVITNMEEQAKKESELLLKNKSKFVNKEVRYETKYKIGNVIRKILEFAEKENVKFILVGKRDVGFIKRLFAGSISDKIKKRSKIPVLIIESQKSEKDDDIGYDSRIIDAYGKISEMLDTKKNNPKN